MRIKSMMKQIALALTLSTALVSGAVAQTAPPAPAAPAAAPAAPAAAPAAPAAKSAAPAAAELAQVPATPDECIKAAFDLAQTAEDKKMSNDELDKIEQMLSKMETHCDANQFTEAMAVSKDIKTFINAKQ